MDRQRTAQEPTATPAPIVDEAAARDAAADAVAVAMGEPNRQRRIHRRSVASAKIEYSPGAWSQDWIVSYNSKADRWTASDWRSSEDGSGEMSRARGDLGRAVDFVANLIWEHEGHMRGLWVRRPDATENVELRRYLGRLRARLAGSGIEFRG